MIELRDFENGLCPLTRPGGYSKEDRRKVIKWMERKLLYEPGFPHPHHEAFMLLTPEGRVEAGIVDAVRPVKEVQRGLF